MKVLAIGDIHGRNDWKKIPFEYYDAIVFIGDYLDSRQGFSDQKIIKNLREIVRLKTKFDHIYFLIGNHDLQYTKPEFESYVTGYRESYAKQANTLLKKINWQFALELDGVLYSHAGILRKFYELIEDPKSNIADSINSFGFENEELFLTCVGYKRGGSAEAGSAIWCDYEELVEEDNPLPIHQVFGHTATRGGRIVFKGPYYRQCIDILHKYPIAYEILDGGTPLPVLLR